MEPLFSFLKHWIIPVDKALDLFNLFANIATSPKFRNMMNKFFLVLILSLGGPYSQEKYVDESLKSLVLIQADFQTVVLPEIIGLEPTIPTTLTLAEQSTPTFAGVITNCFFPSETTHGWHMQKYKLAGLVIRRTMTCPVVSKDNKIS